MLRTKVKCPAKYKMPSFLNPLIVYKHVCANCVALHLSKTARYFLTNIKEHLKRNSKVAYYHHFSSYKDCFNGCIHDYFFILIILRRSTNLWSSRVNLKNDFTLFQINRKNWEAKIPLDSYFSLPISKPCSHFIPLENTRKPLVFSGGIKWEHWSKMG